MTATFGSLILNIGTKYAAAFPVANSTAIFANPFDLQHVLTQLKLSANSN
jgi:hypothetical protein